MTIELSQYLTNPLLDQVKANHSELIQGQRFTHNTRTYLVEMIETTVDEDKALVIIARSADRLFGEIFYEDKTSEFIKTITCNNCPPQLKTIIGLDKRSDGVDDIVYSGVALTERQQVLVDLFKKEDEIPPLAEGYSRKQRSFALLVSVLALTTVGYGIHKVRKGDITLPMRKEIGDFLSKTKANASEYLSQLRQKKPQEGVKA